MKKFILILFLIFTITFLNSCFREIIDARHEMEHSKTAYKQCLEEHPDDPDKCEALRRAYEADLKAYRAIMPSDNISVEKNH